MADAVLSANCQEAAEETLRELVQGLNGIASKHDYDVPPMTTEEFVHDCYLKGWTFEDEWA